MSASPVPRVQVGSFAHNTKGVSRIADYEMRGSCSCVSQGKSADIVVCLAQRFGLACPHSLRDATNCCATHYVGASSTSHNHIKYECLCGLCSWSSLKMMGDHHFFYALVQLPATYFPSYKQKSKRHKFACIFVWWSNIKDIRTPNTHAVNTQIL